MFNILIVEDEALQRSNLIKILRKVEADINIFEAATVETAMEIALSESINLFFIDICLGDDSGMEFANKIRQHHQYKLTWMVFLTTHRHYILEAFKKMHCYDYLIKPYKESAILSMVANFIEDSSPAVEPVIEKRFIHLNMEDVKIKVLLEDIMYTEVFLRTCYIHAKDKVYKVDYMSLKVFLESVKGANFIKCHRSFVVNAAYIRGYQKNSEGIRLLLENKETIPVGRNYKFILDSI